MNIFERAMRGALRPAPDIKPWQWMEEHCYHDDESARRGERWQSSTAPFLRKVTEAIADPVVRDLVIRCAAQSGKTMTVMMMVCWIIVNDPGPMLWVMAAADEVGTFKRQRLYPVMTKCKPVRDLIPQDRTSNRALEINFATMSLNLRGANSKSKVQSIPVRWLIQDEKRNYPAWAHGMLSKRVRSHWNYKKIDISTPSEKDDILDLDFLKGSQEHFYSECPHCDHREVLSMTVDGGKPKPGPGLKWDENETTRPGGEWNFDKMALTVRYEFGCGHVVQDTPATRQALMEGDDWRPHNLNAAAKSRSFTWSALLPEWVKWRSIVEEYLSAFESLKKGDSEPMKTFYTETLGKSYHGGLSAIKNWDFLAARKRPYKLARNLPPGEKWRWEHELRRFFTIDVQGKGGRHYRWIARAFGPNNRSRLIDYGTAWSMEDLKAKMRELEIDDNDVAEDCGNWRGEVFGDVIASGYKWKAMRGDKAQFFTIDGVKTIWQWTWADPAIGEANERRVAPLKVLVFSSSGAKDKLATLMHGMEVGTVDGVVQRESGWEISDEVEDDYLSQLTAEERGPDGKWTPLREHNHWFDCEQEALIAAMVTGVVWVADTKKDEKQTELFKPEEAPSITPAPAPDDGTRMYELKQW